jgi:hypothetical protein
MDVVNLLCNTIATLNFPYFLQGTFSGAEYPDSFITYIINSSDDRAHYDDNATSWTWNATVIFYTRDPELLATVPALIRSTLKNAGFIPTGKGYNIFSDDPNFTGWTNEYLFLDK